MLAHSKELICPEAGCGVQLFPRPKSAKSAVARHLWLGTQQRDGCDHWTGGSDGGPMTPRHLWVQTRLLEMCRELGFSAVAEDHHTRADVLVAAPATALEVQLRPTAFVDRTQSRRDKGVDTVWFIASDVSRKNPSVRTAVATLPTVYFEVRDRRFHASRSGFSPWDDPSGDLSQHAEIKVFGTVFDLSATASTPTLTHGGMSAREFLREVLSGERRWMEPGRPGMPIIQQGRNRPGWVRPPDLAAVSLTDHKKRTPAPAAEPEVPAVPRQPALPSTSVPEMSDDRLGCSPGLMMTIGLTVVIVLGLLLLL